MSEYLVTFILRGCPVLLYNGQHQTSGMAASKWNKDHVKMESLVLFFLQVFPHISSYLWKGLFKGILYM